MPHRNQTFIAALSVLVILQIIMLGALFAGVPPHPPVKTPLFGIAPFLAASVSAAIAAILAGAGSNRASRYLGLLSAVMALVSFGPQKYFDAQFGLIWPAVIAAQLACLAVVTAVFSVSRTTGTQDREWQSA